MGKAKIPAPMKIFPFRCVAFLILLPWMAGAQTEQSTPTPDPLAGIPVQVLDQQEVEMGDHKITLNRIAPPNLPTAAATPTPTPTPAPKPPPTPGAAPIQEQLSKVVSLSIDSQNLLLTEVQCYNGVKRGLRARLNVDFRLFGGVSQLKTKDACYTYIFTVGFDTADAEANLDIDPPDATASLPDHAGYVITSGQGADCPDDLRGLDALCAYFDANRAQLIANYRKRYDDVEIGGGPPGAPTPKPPDTVVNYWPVKGSVYLNPTH